MGPAKDPRKTAGNSKTLIQTQSLGRVASTNKVQNLQKVPSSVNKPVQNLGKATSTLQMPQNDVKIINEVKQQTPKKVEPRKSIANFGFAGLGLGIKPSLPAVASAVMTNAGKPAPGNVPAKPATQLQVPKGRSSGRKSPTNPNKLAVGSTPRNKSSLEGSGDTHNSRNRSPNSSGGSHSSGGSLYNADDKRGKKQKGKANKIKRDNIFTRVKYEIADNDAMLERTGDYPHVSCIKMCLVLVPIFSLILFWDTLALVVFQIPRYSMIEHPCFILVFQSVCILMSMYGYCIQITENHKHSMVTKSIIAIVCHVILFAWRVFYELEMDGYRYQEKSYLPKSRF